MEIQKGCQVFIETLPFSVLEFTPCQSGFLPLMLLLGSALIWKFYNKKKLSLKVVEYLKLSSAQGPRGSKCTAAGFSFYLWHTGLGTLGMVEGGGGGGGGESMGMGCLQALFFITRMDFKKIPEF